MKKILLAVVLLITFSFASEGSSKVKTPALKKVSVKDDKSSEAEAYFNGMKKLEFLSQYKLHGNETEKKVQIKEMLDSLKNGMELFSIAGKSDKWYVPSIIQAGNLFLEMANVVKNQERSADVKHPEVIAAENMAVLQMLPEYYEQAKFTFMAGLDKVRSRNIRDKNVALLGEYFIHTFFNICNVYEEISDIFTKDALLPDSTAIVQEYVKEEGLPESEAVKMTHEDLEAYREEMGSRRENLKKLAITTCEGGLSAADKYGLKNAQVDAIKSLLRKLDPKKSKGK